MTATTRMPIKACQTLCTTPNQKNRKVTNSTATMPITTTFMEMSLWVRSTGSAEAFLPLNSLAASPTEDLITPHDLMMLMTPAMAMPPMPIWRA